MIWLCLALAWLAFITSVLALMAAVAARDHAERLRWEVTPLLRQRSLIGKVETEWDDVRIIGRNGGSSA